MVSGRTGVKTGKTVVMVRPEGVVRGGMVGNSPIARAVTHTGGAILMVKVWVT